MATLNLTKLATASIILDGEKVAVKKILKTKQEVIMMNGDRLPLESIRAVGRGFVYDAPVKSGKTAKAPAAVKPAAVKPDAKANAGVPGRGAPVTAEELSEPGKHVRTKDGERLAVDSVIKSKGIIKLAGNVRVELANIVRRGQGYVELDVTDVPATPANKPSAKPAAKPANTPAKPEHIAIEPKQLRGARVKVGGRYETVEKIFGAKGQVMTDKGTRLEVANIHQKGTKYIYGEVEAAPAPAPKQKAESAPQTGGIRRRAEVVDIKTGSTKPAADKTPTAKPSKLRKVEAMTFDLSEEIRMAAEALVKDAVTKMFDLKFVTSAAVFNNEVLTVDCTFALGSFSPKQIATLIAEMKAEEEDDDSEEEENEEEENEEDENEEDDSEEEDDNEEFDDSELTGTDDDDDSEEEDDDSEDDDSEEEDDTDDEDENEFENDDDDSEEEEEDEIEAKIEAGVAALEKKFGKHSSFRSYAENYLLSDAVEKAFGDDMVVGVTKLNTDKGVYTLVGLHDDGTVVLINNKTQKLRKCEIAAVARMEEV